MRSLEVIVDAGQVNLWRLWALAGRLVSLNLFVDSAGLSCDCCDLKCLMLRELFQKVAMKVAVFFRFLLRLQCERK